MASNSNRVALITGGSVGAGLGIAEQLAADGFDLAISGRRPESEIAEVLGKLKSLGAHTVYLRSDLLDSVGRQRMIDRIHDAFGRLDVLVNNARGVPDQRTDILEVTEESFEELISFHLQAPYFLTQLAANWMIEQRQASENFVGTIVNIFALKAELASDNPDDYGIVDAGVSMATKLWANRLAEYDIQVFEVRPGFYRTDMADAAAEQDDELAADQLEVDPRWGDASQLGRAVKLLVSGELRSATGNVLTLDGGLTLPRL